MSKAQAAIQAYSSNSGKIKDFRAQEYDVILEVTRDLKRLQCNSSASFQDTVKVVYKNEKLWNAIGVQVADDDNELPDTLRASLLYMSKFVSHQSTQVLKKSADVSALIDVNVSVLRGLKGINV